MGKRQPDRFRPIPPRPIRICLSQSATELVRISGDMRDLLAEIRNLLAEGAAQQGAVQEERGAGLETVIIAESEEEDEENIE